MRSTDTFHADRLWKYLNNPLPGQGPEEPKGVPVNGEVKWVVNKVLLSRLVYEKLKYEVC